MYQNAIYQLRDLGLIAEGDVAVGCRDANVGAAIWFGAIGAAIAASKANQYILSANANEIRLFDIDKKSGQYAGSYSSFLNETVRVASIGGAFGSRTIVIKTDSDKVTLNGQTKVKGFDQKAEFARLKELLFTAYRRK